MIGRRALLGGLAREPRAAAAGAPALTKAARGRAPAAETFTLANGLQVVVLPSQRAPIVTQVLVYKVGSADETLGQTGVAHFLEHMMFKGTDTIGAGRVLEHRLAQRRPRQRLHQLRHRPATTRPSPPIGSRWSCAWKPTAWPTCASSRRS